MRRYGKRLLSIVLERSVNNEVKGLLNLYYITKARWGDNGRD